MRKIVPLAAVLAPLSVLAATAAAVTPAQLTKAGWACFTDPGAPRIVCSDPAHGRPVVGDPSPPASYNLKAFTLDGAFIGTIHLIRSDLYNGQPCPQTGGQYFPITVLGYHRCEHF
ncbi:MAG TPA: hypothetical protein VHJ58_16205 [Vicinamibacterales bacterium]|nr:hypothetical protein [Vicinamibacterales bacterium]